MLNILYPVCHDRINQVSFIFIMVQITIFKLYVTINTDPKELFGGEWKTIDNNNNTVIYMWECIS